LAGKKVLLVDDEKEFVEVTRVLLESNGFEVVTAYDGAGGQTQATAERPDLIVLDVMMETKTAGFDVARWLRTNEETKEIPIIMLTAVNQEVPWRFEPDDIWLPVDVFLDKPVSPERLLAEAKKATS
jgi:two-component system alkaline phosphatase synthesis response regulator PhoP